MVFLALGGDVSRQLFYILAVLLSSGATFLCNYIYSQRLSVEAYGQFGLLLGLLGIFGSFAMLGQATAFTTVFFSDEKRGGASSYPELIKSLKLICISSLIVIFLGLSLWFVFFQGVVGVALAVGLSAAIVMSAYRDFFISAITCTDSYKVYLCSVAVFAVTFVSVVFYGATVEYYFYGLALASMFLSVISMAVLGKKIKPLQEIRGRIFTANELVSFGWVAIPGMLISAMNSYVDRYMIMGMLSLKEVGYYTLAATLSVGVGNVLVNSLVRANVVTMLQALQKNNIEKYLRVSQNVYLVLGFAACMASICYYFFGQELIVYIFGEKYREATTLMVPLFLCVIIVGASQVVGQALVQGKKLYILVRVSVVILMTNVAANYFLISFLGVKGAVAAFAISVITGLLIICKCSRNIAEYIEYPNKFIFLILSLILLNLWGYS